MIRLAVRKVNRRRGVARLICVALTIYMSSTDGVKAQNSGAFTLKITEKEMKLEQPTDMMWDKYLMWDLAFQRMNDRNMPYIELANDASSTAPITELHLSIGDTRFNFSQDVMGKYAMLGSTTPGFQITTSTMGNLGDELVVSIGGGGLIPGQLLRFKVDLAVDAAYADEFFTHPDYRTVLFDMNGFNVYDGLQQQSTADNAKAWVVFDPPSGAEFATPPVALQDEIVSGSAADFYNNNYRRYGEMDPVRTFILNGGSASDGAVPEPCSWLLACAGIVAGMSYRTRSRHCVRGI
jgi:hypothetical protein